MAAFDILSHIDKLIPDGGSVSNGDHSYKCPLCAAANFKVNLRTGRWGTFSCDCGSTEDGKRRIRDALSPAANPKATANTIQPYSSAKAIRPQAKRVWSYADAASKPTIEVHRSDDGNGNRKIWQVSLVSGKKPRDLISTVRPYRCADALQAITDGAPRIYWVEGEPCADALWVLGLPAVTSIGGSGKFDPDRDGGHIPPDRLVVVPDQDQPGLKHAHAVAAAHPGCSWLLPFPGSPQWNGSCPPDGGADIADWIHQGATVEQILDAITTTPPATPAEHPQPEAQPAGEAQGKNQIRDFVHDAGSIRQRLIEGLDRISQIEDEVHKAVALITLRRSLDLRAGEFDRLVLSLNDPAESAPTVDANQLLVKASERSPVVIQDLLATGLTAICADGYTGKSAMAYQIAEAIANGTQFAQAFPAKQGKVIFVQKDEGEGGARESLRKIGIETPDNTLVFRWSMTRHQVASLKKQILATGAIGVVMDSLMTIAGTDIKPTDAEFSIFLYELNSLAKELDIFILVLHHTLKAQRQQKSDFKTDKKLPGEYYRMDRDEIYGSAFVFNACMDCWMMWQFAREDRAEKLFALGNIKCRSGVVESDCIYEFEGNDEDHRFILKSRRGQVLSLRDGATHRERVLHFLRSRDGRGYTIQQINRLVGLGNAKYAAKILTKLFSDPSSKVERRQLSVLSGVGRPAYYYYAAGYTFNGESDSTAAALDSADCSEAEDGDQSQKSPGFPIERKLWKITDNPSHTNGSAPVSEGGKLGADLGGPGAISEGTSDFLPSTSSFSSPISHPPLTPLGERGEESERERSLRVERGFTPSHTSLEKEEGISDGSPQVPGPSEMLARIRQRRILDH